MPSKSLPSRPSLDHLKYQAKDLLNGHRARKLEAFTRIRQSHPKFAGKGDHEIPVARLSLSDAQLVVAREYGFQSWAKLKRHVESLNRSNALVANPTGGSPAASSHAERVARFLEYACPDHHVRGGVAHIMARNAAARMLKQHPEMARDSLYTAVVCGDLEEVERILSRKPELLSEKYSATGPDRAGVGGSEDLFKDLGPKRWEPLLYLCFTRFPIAAASDNAVAIARALLDRGADPNAYFMAGDSRYTPLVGVIGEGEENRPAHPQRDALTRLLLERGAEPFDMQVIYNTHFRGDVLWFLKLIHEQSMRSGRQAVWEDPNWAMLDMGGYGSGARYLLGIALNRNDLELAEWCLAHGASPNAAPPSHPKWSKRTLHEEAFRRGLTEMAELLARYGATPTVAVLEGEEAFVAACLRLDHEEARSLLAKHPEFMNSPVAMFEAAEWDRADVAAFLLDLGMSPNVEGAQGQRALHVAAYNDSEHLAALLIERGAAVDPVDSTHDGTPLWWAVWGQRQRTIELLSRFSRDVWALSFTGNVERLREVMNVEPGLA